MLFVETSDFAQCRRKEESLGRKGAQTYGLGGGQKHIDWIYQNVMCIKRLAR